MCIAILKPKGTRIITDEELENCWEKNPDGFGCMYQVVEGKKKVARSFKTMDKTDALRFAHDIQLDKSVIDIAFHFRWATHGTKDINNCHPFDAGAFFMIHNGVLSLRDPFNEKSDTRLLADMLKAKTEIQWWTDAEKIESLEKFCIGSKLVFLNAEHSFIVNEKGSQAHWIDGIWMSNYSYETYKPYTPPSNSGGAWTKDQNKWRQKQQRLPLKVQAKEEEKDIADFRKYKQEIQGYISPSQRQFLNTFDRFQSNFWWTEYFGYMPTLDEQKEHIDYFCDFVAVSIEELEAFANGNTV